MLVRILLSTYNGAQYLAEQLDSLLAQSYTEFEILVRDDGSEDGTREVIETYISLYPKRIRAFYGERMGYTRSFLTLLAETAAADYFAFCDQDDVWQPHKLRNAVDALQNILTPACYAGAYFAVDEKLKLIGQSDRPIHLDFASALVECKIWGCTVVINAAGRDLILRGLNKARPVSHDWWIYLVFSVLGQIVYDDKPAILYRQHGSNTSGLFRANLVEKMRRRVSSLIKKGATPWRSQALSLFDAYPDEIPITSSLTLQKIRNLNNGFSARLSFALSKSWRRTSKFDNLIFRILVVLNIL